MLRHMPELDWHYGYFGVLGIIALGCCGLFANFKRMGWPSWSLSSSLEGIR